MNAAELPGKESARCEGCKGEESKRARRFAKYRYVSKLVLAKYAEIPIGNSALPRTVLNLLLLTGQIQNYKLKLADIDDGIDNLDRLGWIIAGLYRETSRMGACYYWGT